MAQIFSDDQLMEIAEKTLDVAQKRAGEPSGNERVDYIKAIVGLNVDVGILALKILKERRKAAK